MQIRLMGKLTETSKDTRITLAKFEVKILQSKDTVPLCRKFKQNIGKITYS